jgi:salicylate hydroxylase
MRDHGDMLNIAFGTVGGGGVEGEWGLHGDLDALKASFPLPLSQHHTDNPPQEIYKNYDPRVVKLLDLAKPENTYTWHLSDLPPLPRWSSTNANAVLVGDVVHAMLPTLGMGAAQCIEDSACLALCLDAANSLSDLPKILIAYQTIRKPRTDCTPPF